MSHSLWPHRLQHARLPCLSLSSSLLRLMSTELVMPTNHLVLCRPLFLLPSIFASIRVFSNESTFHIRWPKYWHSSFSISPSNEYSGLISFRIVWCDLLSAFSPERYIASFLKFSFYFILADSWFTMLCEFQCTRCTLLLISCSGHRQSGPISV